MRRAVLAAAMALGGFCAQAQAPEREGYYYPPIGSTEVFARALAESVEGDRLTRIGFVTQFTTQQLAAPYPPRFALFAKGADADEMIIVALDDEIFVTLQRARGVMAQLSAPARATEFFARRRQSDQATFYDMLKVMGFASLTISDGRSWSHQVLFR
jgi:hypothetical protein